jgi:hypothetical protein
MPSSAHDIRAYVDPGGLDAIVVLTFKLPEADLVSFLAKAGYAGELQPVEDELSAAAFFLGFSQYLQGWPSDAEWEQLVTDPTRNLMGQAMEEDGFHRSLLVDETNPELYTVFLVHFEVY